MWNAPRSAQKLRVNLGERDKAPGGGHLHEAILRLSEDLPVVIEIVDVAERIAGFLPWVEEHVVEGLVTLEDCQVLLYRPEGPA